MRGKSGSSFVYMTNIVLVSVASLRDPFLLSNLSGLGEWYLFTVLKTYWFLPQCG